MVVIHLIIAVIILGLIYRRLIKQEVPDTVTKAQALLPIILGIVSVILSIIFFLVIGRISMIAGHSPADLPDIGRSVATAFIAAGLPEEIAKLLMMLLTLLIFRSRVRNVYEYILIGAAVGFGFTLFEEFAYASGSIVTAIGRLCTIAAHMVFGIIMAKHLGTGKYNRLTGQGSVAGQYVLALIIPIIIHTVFDSCTANNQLLNSNDENLQDIGLIISFAMTVFLFILQIVVLRRVMRDAEKYCGMKLKKL